MTRQRFVSSRVLPRGRRRAPLFVTPLVLVLLIGAAGLTAGQDPSSEKPSGEADQSDTPRFRAEANFVRVDVYATENGRAVRDLRAGEFEVYEDGVLQKVETFEHVDVQGWVPQEERREPQSVAEGRAMAEDPRARVFVIFLDTYHTGFVGAYRMRQPLVDFLNRVIAPDDLFAVMTPGMSARDITLARRTTTVEGVLTKHLWGRRDMTLDLDPEERQYEICYPEDALPKQCVVLGQAVEQGPEWLRGVAAEMIARRREKRSLDALTDLAVYLHGLRDERKAVLTVTDGWQLFRPNPNLARIGPCDTPSLPRIGVGPDGRLTTDLAAERELVSESVCDRDRQMLAMLDNWQTYRDLLDRANRANVSFYPVDSRGLAASDAPIEANVPPRQDQLRLQYRIETLRTLADSTDGIAVVNSNDLARGVRRIVDDLTSYYLLGYYSANGKLDGKFRSIKVKIRRPGVDVRARRGYTAPRLDEVQRAQQLASAALAAPANAVQSALASLAAAGRDQRLSMDVSWLAPPAGEPDGTGQLWITGEIDPVSARSSDWAAGGQADLIVTADGTGETIASMRQPIAPASRIVSMALADVKLAPGDYTVQVRLGPQSGTAVLMDSATFTVPEAGPRLGPPRLQRRGPTTGADFAPTANPTFRRSERLRVLVPVPGAPAAVAAELLDRNGSTMAVPVEAMLRPDGNGALTWASAELSLAPLAPGDYVVRTTIERDNHRQDVLAAFRMVP